MTEFNFPKKFQVCTCAEHSPASPELELSKEEIGISKDSAKNVEKLAENVDQILEECPRQILVPVDVLRQLLKIQSSKQKMAEISV